VKERELEDWICNHPYVLGEEAVLIGRQITLEHGRLDILAVRRPYPTQQVLVVELKTRQLKQRDVGQVLRYVNDVKQELLRSIRSWAREILWRRASDCYQVGQEPTAHDAVACTTNAVLDNVSGVLIGTSIDDNLLAACAGARINVSLWHRDGTGIILERIPYKYGKGQQAAEWANRIMDTCIQFGELACNPWSRVYHPEFEK
jgi:Holliday junction resolvase-like predicted endonuclease